MDKVTEHSPNGKRRPTKEDPDFADQEAVRAAQDVSHPLTPDDYEVYSPTRHRDPKEEASEFPEHYAENPLVIDSADEDLKDLPKGYLAVEGLSRTFQGALNYPVTEDKMLEALNHIRENRTQEDGEVEFHNQAQIIAHASQQHGWLTGDKENNINLVHLPVYVKIDDMPAEEAEQVQQGLDIIIKNQIDGRLTEASDIARYFHNETALSDPEGHQSHGWLDDPNNPKPCEEAAVHRANEIYSEHNGIRTLAVELQEEAHNERMDAIRKSRESGAACDSPQKKPRWQTRINNERDDAPGKRLSGHGCRPLF
ncbi:MAG: hypothetical protein MK052_03590 [Alphaproteobacteria bacterium]|nr:hypothetical protein [Alphaproteobacteria bacterium]